MHIGGTGKRSALLVGLTVAMLAAGASVALGVVVKASGGNKLDYKQGIFTQPQGIHSSFENEDSGGIAQFSHNVVSDDSLGGNKLFASKTISFGKTTGINGTQYLTAGDYAFHCSVHPDMKATLHVTNGGTPVARPEITVTVKTKTLHTASGLHGVRVRVDAATKSQNVAIRVEFTNSGKRAGSAKNIDLSAGQSKTVRIHFRPFATSKVRHHLADHTSLKIKATGTVRFGESDSDKQTLGF